MSASQSEVPAEVVLSLLLRKSGQKGIVKTLLATCNATLIEGFPLSGLVFSPQRARFLLARRIVGYMESALPHIRMKGRWEDWPNGCRLCLRTISNSNDLTHLQLALMSNCEEMDSKTRHLNCSCVGQLNTRLKMQWDVDSNDSLGVFGGRSKAFYTLSTRRIRIRYFGGL